MIDTLPQHAADVRNDWTRDEIAALFDLPSAEQRLARPIGRRPDRHGAGFRRGDGAAAQPSADDPHRSALVRFAGLARAGGFRAAL